MQHATDIRLLGADVWFLPVKTRAPLKFGAETLTEVLCARARVTVEDREGRVTSGWGETPLSVPWVWPSELRFDQRQEALRLFAALAARAFVYEPVWGHPMEIGQLYLDFCLPKLLKEFNHQRGGFGPSRADGTPEPMPWLAALVCSSPLDVALHDAYGVRWGRSTYETYTAEYMNRALDSALDPAADKNFNAFYDRHPADYLATAPADTLLAWHLVGGLDALTEAEAPAGAGDDGYPTTLEGWIRRDGLKALKVKLRGTDEAWDYQRLRAVGALGLPLGVERFSADFNCTVEEPAYVCAVLDRLAADAPELYARLDYVEQPFAYDLAARRLDVREISRRKPLFMDESAHSWREVRLGRELGWTGVALKTCKTQTGAILTACWAREHGMPLMVQDLTNPMLAMIPHALLAAWTKTIAGVETNACQFYPDASAAEAGLYPGLYRRRGGAIDLRGLERAGLGLRAAAARRELGPPNVSFGSSPEAAG